MDTWIQDEIGGQWRNARTGKVANHPPRERHVDGHYGGYSETVHYETNGAGVMRETNNPAPHGQTWDQWWHS